MFYYILVGKQNNFLIIDYVCIIIHSNIKIKTMDIDCAIKNGLVTSFDNIPTYIKNINNFVSCNLKNSDLKVIFNPMHGVTGESARLISKLFALKNFDIINDDEDPYFEHKLPSPAEDNLTSLIKSSMLCLKTLPCPAGREIAIGSFGLSKL